MAVGGEDGKKMRPETNLREVNMKYGRLAVFRCHDFAEIWEFRYGLPLGIVTLKIMTRIGVFMLVVFALKCPISSDSRTSSIIFTKIKHEQSRSYQQNDLSKESSQGRRRTKQTERQSRITVDWINLNT
jgi:hypothetical protein